MAMAGPGSARAVKYSVEASPPTIVTLALSSPATVPRVHVALAKPAPSVVLSAGDRLPERACSPVAPALGTPSDRTSTRRGSASGVPTAPVWLLLDATGVAVTPGATAVALKDTGEPSAPSTLVKAVMLPGSIPSVQVADAGPVASLRLRAGTIVPAEASQVTLTPALGVPSDCTRTLRGRGSEVPTTAVWSFVPVTPVSFSAAGAEGSEQASSAIPVRGARGHWLTRCGLSR